MEYLDIVDENDKVIGKASKNEIYDNFLRHRIAHVLVFNERGEMALQLRGNVSYCPFHWGPSAGGHVQSGETYEQAVLREYLEELGVQSKIEFFSKDIFLTPGKPEKFISVFKTNFNGPFNPDAEDVERVEFFSLDQIEKMIKAGEKFHPELLFILNKYLFVSIFKKVEKFVTDAFSKVDKPTDVFHAQRTVYWIKELKPDADEALLVAGFAHDVERAFNGDWKRGSSDPADLRKHQNLSANEIEKFLKQENVDEKFIAKVKHLVAHHEEGGDDEQNILCDADCLAYFEEKAMRWARRAKEEGTEKEMINKIEFYFSRFKSDKAKEIARPFYHDVIDYLKSSV